MLKSSMFLLESISAQRMLVVVVVVKGFYFVLAVVELLVNSSGSQGER